MEGSPVCEKGRVGIESIVGGETEHKVGGRGAIRLSLGVMTSGRESLWWGRGGRRCQSM